jgi:hypothetical protein
LISIGKIIRNGFEKSSSSLATERDSRIDPGLGAGIDAAKAAKALKFLPEKGTYQDINYRLA